MNGPEDLSVTHSSATPDPKNCSLVSIIPIVGMSSCRGRAEAFARRLSSKLRTLGTQADGADISQEDEPIINGGNTWVTGDGGEQTVTDLQPLRHESDSFFDFDCELESPGSPVDECEYLRLIESTSNTPHNSAAESGYACTSAASSHSSSDGPYYDVNSENEACTSHIQQPQPQPQQQQPHRHPHKLQKQLHICEAHQPGKDETDFASSCAAAVPVPVPAAASTVSDSQCNGYLSHEDLTQTLPSEGPDIELANNNELEIETPEEIDIMQSVQAQILRELRKQSLEYNDEMGDNNIRNFEKPEMVTEIETSTAKVMVMPTVKKTETETETEAETSTAKVTVIPTVRKTETETETETSIAKVTIVPTVKETETETENETQTQTETNTVTETETHTAQVEALEDQNTKQTAHITNGHTEGGEDVLKVEVEEVLKAEITESQIETDVPALDDEAPVKDSSESEISKSELNEKPKTTHLHMDTTDDEDDCRPQRVRRCSSLKTGKTPPGTPGRKKIVRFADVLGLDLADIKTFLDEIPTVPKSAYEDLEILESEPPVQLGPRSDKLLMPLFQQPGGLSNFLDIVREKLVSLENAAVTDGINHTITGSVRVRNLDFHKSVHIRYSLDGWRSFADLQANYVENSCDGFSDKFSFVLFGNSLHIGQRLEFAARFQCKGQQYWDNNYGANYCFQCLPTRGPIINPILTVLPLHHNNNLTSILSPTVGDPWCTSFY